MRADTDAPQVVHGQNAGLEEASDEAWWDALWQTIAEQPSNGGAEVDASPQEASSALADAGRALGELSAAIGDAPSGRGQTKKLRSVAASTRLA